MNVSWTPDIWGAVRRLIEQNKATAQADEATLANATLSEQALLATTLIELRMADAGIDLQQRTVDAYKKSFDVTEQQGSGTVGYVQKELGLFVQDDYRVRPNLSLSL